MEDSVKILTTDDLADWSALLARLPEAQRDVYFTPEYCQLFEKKGEGKAICFVFQQDSGLAIYPFLMNCVNDLGYDLDTNYYDIMGAYGYNGAASNSTDAEFMRAFEKAWLEWARSKNIIAEFIRYNPVLSNEKLCPWAPPVDVLDNVLLPLDDYEHIWKVSYDRALRNALRRADKQGFSFIMQTGAEIDSELYHSFTELYAHTMQRRSANDYYFFDEDFFDNLKSGLGSHLLLAAVLFDGKVVSADLDLHNGINIYGFLSGTFSEYLHLNPTSWMRDQKIRKLVGLGFKNHSMGGGMQRNDSIYKYKKSFSIATDSLFYIGRKIHNHDVYALVVTQWKEKLGTSFASFDHLFLKYRYGL
jgi:hypothetical protein